MFNEAAEKWNRIESANERGTILVWASMVVMFVGGVILAGADSMRAVAKTMRSDYAAASLPNEIARSGLVDTFAWFRRQVVQPVETFQPRRDIANNVNETDNESVGLIRTFEITPGVWARYLSRAGGPGEAFDDADGNGHYDVGESFDDTDGDGFWSPPALTRDVTTERGLPGRGSIWLLVATATVYTRPRADLPLGEGPNQIIGRSEMATEIRRLTINPPAAAGLCVANGSEINLGTRSRVRAKDTAVAYAPGTGSPSLSGAELDGRDVAIPEYASRVEDVFGVKWSELRSMADISTTDGVLGVPRRIPQSALVVVSDDIAFTLKRPLRGNGVVVVNGNCTIEAGSNTFFNGLLFVEGDLIVRGPAYLQGAVIVNGACDIRGSGDYCEIKHDPKTINDLLVRMGQYRMSKAPYRVSRTLADGRPSEVAVSRRRLGDGYAAALSPKGVKGSLGGSVVGPSTPLPPAPSSLFTTTAVQDAIDAYLSANPDSPGVSLMVGASDDLVVAERLLAQSPADTSGALDAVRAAMEKMGAAVEAGGSVNSLADPLGGGGTGLLPEMSAMVESMIGVSDADAPTVATAEGQVAAANTSTERGAARMAAGNEAGAMADYGAAASSLRDAVGTLTP